MPVALPPVITINTNITAKRQNPVPLPTRLSHLNHLERLKTLNSCSPKSPFSVLRGCRQKRLHAKSQGQVGIMGGNCQEAIIWGSPRPPGLASEGVGLLSYFSVHPLLLHPGYLDQNTFTQGDSECRLRQAQGCPGTRCLGQEPWSQASGDHRGRWSQGRDARNQTDSAPDLCSRLSVLTCRAGWLRAWALGPGCLVQTLVLPLNVCVTPGKLLALSPP